MNLTANCCSGPRRYVNPDFCFGRETTSYLDLGCRAGLKNRSASTENCPVLNLGPSYLVRCPSIRFRGCQTGSNLHRTARQLLATADLRVPSILRSGLSYCRQSTQRPQPLRVYSFSSCCLPFAFPNDRPSVHY